MSVSSNTSHSTSTILDSNRSDTPAIHGITPNDALFNAVENASEQAFPQTLQEALSNGAELNATNKEGKCLLECAVQRGSERIAYALIAAGADVPDVGSDGIDLLMQAAFDNQPAMVMLLTDKGKMSVECADATGQTALHYAVRGGSLQSVIALLERGADCNAETTALSAALRDNLFSNDQFPAQGVTPFAMAVALGWPDIAQALLTRGAQLCAGSMNPLAVAVACNRPDMVVLIFQQAAQTSETHRLLTQGTLEIAAVVTQQTTILGQLLRCRQQHQLKHLDLRPLVALATKFNHTEQLAMLRAHTARAVPARRNLNFDAEPAVQTAIPESTPTFSAPAAQPQRDGEIGTRKRKTDPDAPHPAAKQPRED